MTIVGSCSGTIGSGLVWGYFKEWSTIMYFAGCGPVLIVGCTAVAGLMTERQRRNAGGGTISQSLQGGE